MMKLSPECGGRTTPDVVAVEGRELSELDYIEEGRYRKVLSRASTSPTTVEVKLSCAKCNLVSKFRIGDKDEASARTKGIAEGRTVIAMNCPIINPNSRYKLST